MNYHPDQLARHDFCEGSALYQIYRIFMSAQALKVMYFYIFSMNDSALVISGLAYDPNPPRSSTPNFNKVKNIDEWTIDTS